MEKILNELKEIKATLNIHGKMIESIVEMLSERVHDSEKTKQDVNSQMNSVFTMLQDNPALKDNPILTQLFANFKEKTNDR